MTPRFEVGQSVALVSNRDDIGTVMTIDERRMEPEYLVFFTAQRKASYPERSLCLPDGDDEASRDPEEMLIEWRLGGPQAFRTFLTLAKLRQPLADNLYSFVASRTERLPYQFKPVLKMLEGAYSRLLIADEVGLGKTIEAGIILVELQQRTQLDNVLVLCPSALTRKWRKELAERFELDFDVLDGPALRERVVEAADDGRPLRAIVSIELARREENFDVLLDHEFPIDALIVDEAHHLRNRGTRTNAVGDLLTQRAHSAVFLTATPLNLGAQDFFNLLNLLVPEEFNDFATFSSLIEPNASINAALRTMRAAFPPAFGEALSELREVEATSQGPRLQRNGRYQKVVARLGAAADGAGLSRDGCVDIQRDLIELNALSHVFTRTKKREVQEHFPTRRAEPITVDFTTTERAFYEAVTAWVAERHEEEGMMARGFVTTMVQRQAASCLPAVKEKLRDTVTTGAWAMASDEAAELDVDYEDDEEHVRLIDVPTDTLEQLRDAWERYDGVDSKYEAFETALSALVNQGEKKVLVFSFFRATIDYLERRLEALHGNGGPIRVFKIYGPMSADERHKSIQAFRDSAEPAVLLSSEVGSEGLDFQFCAAMVNYDLPWNPMRVEQRIGRIDRYGQIAPLIQILNMRVTDTVEDRIFYRLYERIQIFEQSIGDLEAILGDREINLRDLQRDAISRRLTPEEEERRALQIADVIVRRQKEHEEFDEKSRKFLGNDDVFVERFNDIKRSRKFVAPDELRELVVTFLHEQFPDVRLVQAEDGRPSTFELHDDARTDIFSRTLHAMVAASPEKARVARQFLARLDSDRSLRVTFEPEIALQDRTVDFVSLHHPLITAIQTAYQSDDQLLPTALLGVRTDVAGTGPRCFFIYELIAAGLKDRIEFVTVMARGDEVDEQLGAEFLRLLPGTYALADTRPMLARDEIEQAAATARDWISSARDRREAELQQTNDEVIEAQLESLRLGADRSRLAWSAQVAEQPDPRIRRMRLAQLANLDRDLEERVQRLEKKRGVSVGLRLVAAGVLVVEAPVAATS